MSVRYFNRYSGKLETEEIYGGGFVRLVYGSSVGWPLAFLIARRVWFARAYGAWMRRASSRRMVVPFVQRFGIDPSELEKAPEDFASFNDFFVRTLRASSRPIHPGPNTAVFPADGRHLGFQDVSTGSRVFVKGQRLDLASLLADPDEARRFEGGALVLSRLCPVDYHRFHFPVAGHAGRPRTIDGPLDSVNPIALVRRIQILFENRRVTTAIEAGGFGRVVVAEIGASCVGSIVQTFVPDAGVEKGAEKGYFQFGGSAMITLFEPGRVDLAGDLIEQSREGIELYARMGDRMGTTTNLDVSHGGTETRRTAKAASF